MDNLTLFMTQEYLIAERGEPVGNRYDLAIQIRTTNIIM